MLTTLVAKEEEEEWEWTAVGQELNSGGQVPVPPLLRDKKAHLIESLTFLKRCRDNKDRDQLDEALSVVGCFHRKRLRRYSASLSARFPGALPTSHPEPPFCPRCPRHVRVGTDSRVPYREFCRSFGYPVALARSAPWPGDDAALLGFYELRGTGGSLVQRGHATGCAARGYHPETLLFDAEGHLDSVLLTLGLGHGAVTRVALFSSHAPCGHEALGCVSRILGFLEAHPGVRLEVYFAQFESGFAEAVRGYHRPPYGQRDGTDEGGSLRDLVGLRPRVTVAPISGGMWGKILRDFVSNVPPLALMNPVNHLRAREDSENAARLAGTTGVWPPYVDLAPVPSRQYRDLVFGDFGHQFDDQRDHDELTNARSDHYLSEKRTTVKRPRRFNPDTLQSPPMMVLPPIFMPLEHSPPPPPPPPPPPSHPLPPPPAHSWGYSQPWTPHWSQSWTQPWTPQPWTPQPWTPQPWTQAWAQAWAQPWTQPLTPAQTYPWPQAWTPAWRQPEPQVVRHMTLPDLPPPPKQKEKTIQEMLPPNGIIKDFTITQEKPVKQRADTTGKSDKGKKSTKKK
ncbi:putative C-_U-editing enzyme APOBEC-4 [Lethenteron reissneri]|uniref:putative C->U-editing enzyme APOBEC-4 n=1 Tax=Lethenteron reissneri TaxID=7753 RepID=UPI002AB6142A|nr:putative C->U-editing enzyme APOBEC-4 [Lethenteron reissneri]